MSGGDGYSGGGGGGEGVADAQPASHVHQEARSGAVSMLPLLGDHREGGGTRLVLASFVLHAILSFSLPR